MKLIWIKKYIIIEFNTYPINTFDNTKRCIISFLKKTFFINVPEKYRYCIKTNDFNTEIYISKLVLNWNTINLNYYHKSYNTEYKEYFQKWKVLKGYSVKSK